MNKKTKWSFLSLISLCVNMTWLKVASGSQQSLLGKNLRKDHSRPSMEMGREDSTTSCLKFVCFVFRIWQKLRRLLAPRLSWNTPPGLDDKEFWFCIQFMEEDSIGLREGFWSCNTAYVYLVVNSTEINRMYFWVNMHKITLKLISFSSSFKKQNHSLTTLVLWTTLNPHYCTIKKWDLHPAWANSQLVPFLPMVFNQQTHLTWNKLVPPKVEEQEQGYLIAVCIAGATVS